MIFYTAGDVPSKLFTWNEEGRMTLTMPMGTHTARTICEADWSRYRDLHGNSQIKQHMKGGAITEEESRESFKWMMERVRHNNPIVPLALVREGTETVDGLICLFTSGWPGVGEVIRMLDTQQQGSGLGTRSLQYLVSVLAPEMGRLGLLGVEHFTFQGEVLREVYATADPKNAPSWKSWDKIVGVQNAWVEGTWPDDNTGRIRALKEAYGSTRYCMKVDVQPVQGYLPVVVNDNEKNLNQIRYKETTPRSPHLGSLVHPYFIIHQRLLPPWKPSYGLY